MVDNFQRDGVPIVEAHTVSNGMANCAPSIDSISLHSGVRSNTVRGARFFAHSADVALQV